MVQRGRTVPTGKLTARLIPGPNHQADPASRMWRLKNSLRWGYIKGWWANGLARAFGRLTGLHVMTSELRAVLIKANGVTIDYGVISRQLVTDAFVEFQVDQMQVETSEWGDFKYHDSGVGVTAANVADTDIETTDGEARAVGSQAEGATAEIYQSVGTITYSGALAITEHGLFSNAAGATLLDRHVFAAINVVNLDSIEFTYEYTISSGG